MIAGATDKGINVSKQ